MEEVLEIRDGCSTPEQLLKSLAFARYLKIYKRAFIENLESRPENRQLEAQPKIEFIKNIKIRDIVAILDSKKNSRAKKEKIKRYRI